MEIVGFQKVTWAFKMSLHGKWITCKCNMQQGIKDEMESMERCGDMGKHVFAHGGANAYGEAKMNFIDTFEEK